MKISYDRLADAVYIQFADAIPPGGVDSTYFCNPDEVGGIVNLDRDDAGHIIGLEVLTASALLASRVACKRELA